jgi:hypothetical protein
MGAWARSCLRTLGLRGEAQDQARQRRGDDGRLGPISLRTLGLRGRTRSSPAAEGGDGAWARFSLRTLGLLGRRSRSSPSATGRRWAPGADFSAHSRASGKNKIKPGAEGGDGGRGRCCLRLSGSWGQDQGQARQRRGDNGRLGPIFSAHSRGSGAKIKVKPVSDGRRWGVWARFSPRTLGLLGEEQDQARRGGWRWGVWAGVVCALSGLWGQDQGQAGSEGRRWGGWAGSWAPDPAWTRRLSP